MIMFLERRCLYRGVEGPPENPSGNITDKWYVVVCKVTAPLPKKW